MAFGIEDYTDRCTAIGIIFLSFKPVVVTIYTQIEVLIFMGQLHFYLTNVCLYEKEIGRIYSQQY